MSALQLPTIVFYGTPDFAVPSLQILVENHFPVIAVVTAPDKPSGRGLTVQASAIKKYAEKVGIPVLQPLSLKDSLFQETLRQLKPELQIVVAFRKLPEAIWKLPVLGTFNLHASILPDYRGAAPINWSLINGDSETGLTTFLINENIDEGKVLLYVKLPVSFEENAGTLHDRLKETGAKLVLETALGLANKSLQAVIQPFVLPDGRNPRPAPKIFREDCKISWEKSSIEIYNLIRGLSPSPGAYSTLADGEGNHWHLKIYSAKIVQNEAVASIGQILTDNRTYLLVQCGKGWIQLLSIQLPGKKALFVKELLNGFKIGTNWKFLT